MSFLKAVCHAMERIAPLRYAEKWDNVGLLLEAPTPVTSQQPPDRVLLTIDLTPPVVDEAINANVSIIIAYHTSIFKPLSALTLSNPLQASLLRCAQAGISIYTPHTALDSIRGGINDWLASGVGAGRTEFLEAKDEHAGAGRKLTLNEPVTLDEIKQRIKDALRISEVQVARPHGSEPSRKIQTVGICAGSGGGLLNGVDADLYFTGEMAHHEVLSAIGDGRTVILCGHTNTERGYLNVLRSELSKHLGANSELDGRNVSILISKEDRHPLTFE